MDCVVHTFAVFFAHIEESLSDNLGGGGGGNTHTRTKHPR